MTQQHLDERVNEARQKSPARAVKVGDEDNGKHTRNGDAATKRKVKGRNGDEGADEGNGSCQSDHHARFCQTSDFECEFHILPPKN